MSRDTISRWVKISLDSAGIDTIQFKPHSTRQTSTSAAKKNAVSLQEILNTALQGAEFANGVLFKKPVYLL